MFGQTLALLKRWIGVPTSSKTIVDADLSASDQDDRRLWVRFAADIEGSVAPADPHANRHAARVVDLSQGGARILVEKPYLVGQILSLQLPTQEDEVRTVLACIVRVQKEDSGQWSLGCVFSQELSEEDLATFGAQRRKASSEDQRRWIRYDCKVRARYRLAQEPASAAKDARVLNISASGIGLEVTPPLRAGALLQVDLLDRHGKQAQSILACVVHTTERSSGELAIGCHFIRELTEEELRSLL